MPCRCRASNVSLGKNTVSLGKNTVSLGKTECECVNYCSLKCYSYVILSSRQIRGCEELMASNQPHHTSQPPNHHVTQLLWTEPLLSQIFSVSLKLQLHDNLARVEHEGLTSDVRTRKKPPPSDPDRTWVLLHVFTWIITALNLHNENMN